MAIDSLQKRASATQFLLPYYPQFLVTDGLISGVDKQVMAWVYSGIAAASFEPYATAVTVITIMIEAASSNEVMIEAVSKDEVMIETGGSDEVM